MGLSLYPEDWPMWASTHSTGAGEQREGRRWLLVQMLSDLASCSVHEISAPPFYVTLREKSDNCKINPSPKSQQL